MSSQFPTTETGFAIQRQRWEAGSLVMTMGAAPLNLLRGLATGNLFLLAMAIDLFIPPLVMLLSILVIGLLLSLGLLIAGGSSFPASIYLLSLLLLIAALTLAWYHFGRNTLSSYDLLSLPSLLIGKFRHYLGIWRSRGAGWIRTDRK